MSHSLPQNKEEICGRGGHWLSYPDPLQINDATHEVLIRCRRCGKQVWIQLTKEGLERLLLWLQTTTKGDGKKG